MPSDPDCYDFETVGELPLSSSFEWGNRGRFVVEARDFENRLIMARGPDGYLTAFRFEHPSDSRGHVASVIPSVPR